MKITAFKVLGIAATRSAVVIAHSTGSGKHFKIECFRVLPFEMRSGEDLELLLRSLHSEFQRERGATIALLRASSGRFGSKLEVVKAEALIELAAAQAGLPIDKVAPQSLKRALKCGPKEKWRDRATKIFGGGDAYENWTKGSAEAASVAYKISNQ